MKLSTRIRFFRFAAVIAIVSLSAGVTTSSALDNGVGRLPAMGYNPWNSCLLDPTLATLKEMVDSMKSKGMLEAGYEYMCTDGGAVMGQPDVGREWFPEIGLQEFTDYGHSKGFKIGYYAQNVRGREDSLVKKWAKMGFDYLKHDDYFIPWDSTPTYVRVRDALAKCGRPVYLTIHPDTKIRMPMRPDTLCHAQRIANDINWKKDSLYWGPTNNNGTGVMGQVMASRARQHLARPGYYNDMDMMGIGMTKFITTIEAQTHFNFWCIMASLLLEGSDIRRISKERLQILLNREVIAVNQDSLGEQGKVVRYRYAPVKNGDSTEVISKRLQDSSRAVMLFNRNGAAKSISVLLSDIGLSGPVYVRDLLQHKDLPVATDSVTIAGIPHHGSAMLRISKNPISGVYHRGPKGASKISGAVQAPMVRMFAKRGASLVKFPPGYAGIEIFNLQGALLWKVRRNSIEDDGEVRIPASFWNSGMVVVRFVDGTPLSKEVR